MREEPIIIAGPCVIEGIDTLKKTASFLKMLSKTYKIEIFFKASFDKANRTSINSYRGPGLIKGISILEDIKKIFKLRLLIDVHETSQIERVAEIADIIQIPAFLSRQTDLIVESAKTNKMINIKKGQFMSPREALLAYEKAKRYSKNRVFITERGTSFGYSDLIVDFRTADLLISKGVEMIMDITHSCQRPALNPQSSGGDKRFALTFAKIASITGFSGLFAEVHPDPENALSDSATQLNFREYRKALNLFLKYHNHNSS
ncbi:MAG: 3-deoxy-8-phosphooctulonate synthase [Myxococcota bacterium]